MSDISFKLLGPEHMTQFRHLQNALFPVTDASKEWITWYFGLGQKFHGIATRIYGAFEGTDLVGCWCVEPKNFALAGGKQIKVTETASYEKLKAKALAEGVNSKAFKDFQRENVKRQGIKI